MPTYEYACSKCGHTFEIGQSISAKALTVCPKEQCPKKPWGKGKVKRGIGGGAGLIFKGSGFYITDYRSDKYKAAAKSDATASGGSSSTTGKSEANTGTSSSTTTKASGSSSESKPASAPSPSKKD